jgi:positive regulator of sigma E activity
VFIFYPILSVCHSHNLLLFYRASQLYMLPLLALFAGGLLGEVIYPEHEAGQIILAFIGFSACLDHHHHRIPTNNS